MSFASLSDLKIYLGIAAGTTSADAELTRLLAMADVTVERYIDRKLAAAAFVERRNGYGTDVMRVKNGPINSVSSLTVDGVGIVSSDGTSAGYLIDGDALYLIGGQYFSCGRKNVVISYNGGFATIPPDIAHSVIEIAAQAFKEKDWIGMQSKTLSGELASFTRGFLPDSAKSVLNLYVRTDPCD